MLRKKDIVILLPIWLIILGLFTYIGATIITALIHEPLAVIGTFMGIIFIVWTLYAVARLFEIIFPLEDSK